MIDQTSPTWKAILKWAEPRLKEATERLEMLGVDAAETENLRGGISMLRELFELTKPAPVMQFPPLHRDH